MALDTVSLETAAAGTSGVVGGVAEDALLGAVGEVSTGLLQHRTALPPSECQRLLSVLRGELVRMSERPIGYAVSPERYTGVDCQLATAGGAFPRGIGSVATRVAVTGGRVLQSSSAGLLARGSATRRLPWAHYLARPGTIELIGKVTADALASGFLRETGPDPVLDLAAINTRTMAEIRRSGLLDGRPPLRSARTRLRWAAVVSRTRPPGTLRFAVESEELRTVLLCCTPEQLAEAAEFCEDLALHEWLLTTLLNLVQRSRLDTAPVDALLHRLRPAVEHLLHLWMPAARAARYAPVFWDGLERRPGLSRQWRATVDRIRDQLSVNTVALLAAARGELPR